MDAYWRVKMLMNAWWTTEAAVARASTRMAVMHVSVQMDFNLTETIHSSASVCLLSLIELSAD